ncbi:MAG: lysyl-tRNA synthetase, class [Abditibacteriota bacterium]|nr:lysyl-tRNA synthetase, class [Abditibacteriota bacterium]
MLSSNPYPELVKRFANQQVVTIATGATCAYLGDERNLREFLVADEVARWLRRAGHTVIFYLIDDSLDPLNFRQLRVAVNKDEKLIEQYKNWCGKPISQLPDPWGCHESYAAHFEEELLNRLHRLDCHPTLVTTAKLYERGVYTPYIRLVLTRYDEIFEFLRTNFEGYKPEKLLWPLCPHCLYIHETDIKKIDKGLVDIHCHSCEQHSSVTFEELQCKLNWKLDCAVRWAYFKIDAEPFSKSYLEPQTGSFAVAQALSREYFGGHKVLPIQYGLVNMEKKFSNTLLASLPGSVLRSLLVDRPATDFKLTRDLLVTAASRYTVMPGLSYLDFIKQLLPMWLLTPQSLTREQRDLLSHGIAFGRHFLDWEAHLPLPTRESIEVEQPAVLSLVHTLLGRVIRLRENSELTSEQFQQSLSGLIDCLGSHKGPTLHRLRILVGQEQGLPAGRFLFLLPLEYLRLLEYMVHLYLQSVGETVSIQEEDPSALSIVSGATQMRAIA